MSTSTIGHRAHTTSRRIGGDTDAMIVRMKRAMLEGNYIRVGDVAEQLGTIQMKDEWIAACGQHVCASCENNVHPRADLRRQTSTLVRERPDWWW